MKKTVLLGEWNKKGKLVYKKRKAETKTRKNVYGRWAEDIANHRRKTGQSKEE